MQLVQHGVGAWPCAAWATPPVEGLARIVVAVADHAGLQRESGVVVRVHVQRVLAVGGELLLAPAEAADDVARIGVEQQLGGVEAVAAVGPPGAVGAQAVDQAGRGAGQVAVPDVAGVARAAAGGKFPRCRPH
jgi:hypothetical protein